MASAGCAKRKQFAKSPSSRGGISRFGFLVTNSLIKDQKSALEMVIWPSSENCLRFAHPAEAIVARERLLVEISVAILLRVIVVLMVIHGGSSSSRKAL